MIIYKKLDNRYAYLRTAGGTPIREFGQIPCKKMHLLETTPLGPEWQATIDTDKWWSHKNIAKNIFALMAQGGPVDSRFIELHRRLLSFGGCETCFPDFEEDMQNILNRGQLWLGDHSILMKGEASRCHSNTANLWETNRTDHEVAIATGYALSKDGIWRQHSWLMQRLHRSVRIVETTTKRLCYYGFVMTDDEAMVFADEN